MHLSLKLLLLKCFLLLEERLLVLLDLALDLAILVLVLLRLLFDLVSGLSNFLQLEVCLGCLHRLLRLLLGLTLLRHGFVVVHDGVEVVICAQLGHVCCGADAVALVPTALLGMLAGIEPLPRLWLLAKLVSLGVVASIHPLLHFSLSQAPFSHLLDCLVSLIHGEAGVDGTPTFLRFQGLIFLYFLRRVLRCFLEDEGALFLQLRHVLLQKCFVFLVLIEEAHRRLEILGGLLVAMDDDFVEQLLLLLV